MTFFAKRSSLVKHYASRGMDLLHRINGPVSWGALFEMKCLQTELGNKIAELERIGHWDRHGNTGAKTAITSIKDQDRPTIGSA